MEHIKIYENDSLGFDHDYYWLELNNEGLDRLIAALQQVKETGEVEVESGRLILTIELLDGETNT